MHISRLVGGLALLVASVGMVLVGPISAVGAQDGPALASLEITVLRSSAGAAVVPVSVEVESFRAIEATLSVSNPGTNTAWEIPYALAANSAVEQILLVPAGQGQLRLQAELVSGGEVIADAEVQANGREAPVNAIGVIGLEAPADELQLTPRVGRASLIDLTDLAMLSGLDSVVASPAGLRTLTPQEALELQRWVSTGHQLVVADRPGSVDDFLPAEWRGDDDLVLADTGLIRYIDADWATRMPPGLSAAVDGQALIGFFDSNQAELLNDAGFRVPGIGALGLLLLAYLVVAGPIAFSVLNRMERQTLAWVVVPGLAVVFTVGVLIVGLVLTQGRGNGFAAIVEVGSPGASVTESVLIADDGRQTLALDDGWNLQSSGLSTTRESVGAPLTVRPTLASTELIFDIDPGGGGSAVISGAAPTLDGALQVVDVEVAENRVEGTVANGTDQTLRNVIVLVGGRVASFDNDLAPGDTATFSVALGRTENVEIPELGTWDVRQQDFFGFGEPRDNDAVQTGPVNGSVWVDWRSSRMGTAAPMGMVTAVGWSRDFDGNVLDGTGRTAVVARAHIPADDQPLRPEQIRSTVALAPDPTFGQFGFDGDVQGSSLVVQHLRPSGSDTSDLELLIANSVSEARLWTGADWQSLDLESQGPGEVRSRIPDAAWIDDALWVEFRIGDFFGDSGAFRTGLAPGRDQTAEIALLPAGESSRRDVFGGGFDGPFGGDAILGAIQPVELDAEGFFDGGGFLEGTYDEWTIDLREGQAVDVRMNANGGGQFVDPFLVIRDPEGRRVAENDDFNGLNSRIEFTADAGGLYTIEARPLDGFGGGGYQLLVETDPPPPEPVDDAPEEEVPDPADEQEPSAEEDAS